MDRHHDRDATQYKRAIERLRNTAGTLSILLQKLEQEADGIPTYLLWEKECATEYNQLAYQTNNLLDKIEGAISEDGRGFRIKRIPIDIVRSIPSLHDKSLRNIVKEREEEERYIDVLGRDSTEESEEEGFHLPLYKKRKISVI